MLILILQLAKNNVAFSRHTSIASRPKKDTTDVKISVGNNDIQKIHLSLSGWTKTKDKSITGERSIHHKYNDVLRFCRLKANKSHLCWKIIGLEPC